MARTRAVAVATALLALAVWVPSPGIHATVPGVGSISGLLGAPRLATPGRAIAPYPTRSVGRAAPEPTERRGVVYLKTAPAIPYLPTMGAAITQRDEAFVPRLVAVTQGSSVSFPNGDGFFHNVFSLSRFAQFNLGRYPRGEARGWRFERAGAVKVFCDIHAQMSATVLVFDHAFFAMADDDGRFRLDGVPAGDHIVAAWHDRGGEQTLGLTVVAGQTATADFVWPPKAP